MPIAATLPDPFDPTPETNEVETNAVETLHPIDAYIRHDLPKAPDMRLAALLREALLRGSISAADQPLINEVVNTLVPPTHIHALPDEEQDEYGYHWKECYDAVVAAIIRLAATRWLAGQPE